MDSAFASSSGMPVEIGHPVDRIEGCRNPGGIDQRGVAKLAADLGLDCGKARVVDAEHGFCERDQQRAMRNVAVARGAGEQAQIVVFTFCLAAPTEQIRVGRGSIKALVEDRDPARNQLDLRVGDGAVLVGEVAHPLAGQILGLDQPEPLDGLFGHQR